MKCLFLRGDNTTLSIIGYYYNVDDIKFYDDSKVSVRFFSEGSFMGMHFLPGDNSISKFRIQLGNSNTGSNVLFNGIISSDNEKFFIGDVYDDFFTVETYKNELRITIVQIDDFCYDIFLDHSFVKKFYHQKEGVSDVSKGDVLEFDYYDIDDNNRKFYGFVQENNQGILALSLSEKDYSFDYVYTGDEIFSHKTFNLLVSQYRRIRNHVKRPIGIEVCSKNTFQVFFDELSFIDEAEAYYNIKPFDKVYSKEEYQFDLYPMNDEDD